MPGDPDGAARVTAMGTPNRMNRDQFYAAIAGLDVEQLRKVLWTVYWRGTGVVRERIETEIAPPEAPARSARSAGTVDPGQVLAAVREFDALARSGAYFAGSRQVSPKARSRWRVTFREQMAQARAALAVEPDLHAPAGAADDPAADPGAEAMTVMIDLANVTRDYEYFRSDDPMEAAGIVVSDEIALLWSRLLERRGFEGFAAAAAGQFVRWAAPYGWTRRGFGRTAEKERSLTDVLAGMLTVPDTWVTFTASFLRVLDGLVPPPAPAGRGKGRGRATGAGFDDDRAYPRRRRTEAVLPWLLLLVERFAGAGGEEEELLDRLAVHPALGGPDLVFVQARLAQARGDADGARALVFQALEVLPGHHDYLAFAARIGAPLPPRAQGIAESRRLPVP